MRQTQSDSPCTCKFGKWAMYSATTMTHRPEEVELWLPFTGEERQVWEGYGVPRVISICYWGSRGDSSDANAWQGYQEDNTVQIFSEFWCQPELSTFLFYFFYKDWKRWGRQISKCKLNPRKQRLLCTDIWVSLRKSKQNLGFLGWAIPRPYASGRHEPAPYDTSPGAERPKPPRR